MHLPKSITRNGPRLQRVKTEQDDQGRAEVEEQPDAREDGTGGEAGAVGNAVVTRLEVAEVGAQACSGMIDALTRQ